MTGREMTGIIYDYSGVVHVHSTLSDGFGPVEKIIRAANQTGCAYLVLTDHNTLAAREKGWEGWHKNTLVLVGSEVSTDTDSHLLALNIRATIPAFIPAQQVLDLIKSQGGLSFLAHPFGGQPEPFLGITSKPWLDWGAQGYTGLEIWNYSVDWKENLLKLPLRLPALLLGVLCPDLRIKGPPPKTLEKWDELTSKGKRIVGLGSVDAHGIGISYRRLFRRLRTHILSRQPFTRRQEEDAAIVYGALARGNCYFSNDVLADAAGFQFSIQGPDTHAIAGEAVPFQQGLTLDLKFPHRCDFRVMLAGQSLLQAAGTGTSFSIAQPGAYRIEAALPKFFGTRPWLYSNPIYVHREATDA